MRAKLAASEFYSAHIWVLLIKIFKQSTVFADQLTDGCSKMTRKTDCMAHEVCWKASILVSAHRPFLCKNSLVRGCTSESFLGLQGSIPRAHVGAEGQTWCCSVHHSYLLRKAAFVFLLEIKIL